MNILSIGNNTFDTNVFTLSFSGEFEKDYLDNYFKSSLRHVRISLLLAIFIYSIFGILDHWIVPEVKEILWFIRYGIFCPYVLAVFLFSYTPYFKKYMQFAIFSVVLLAGIGIIGMIVVAPLPGNYSYYAGLILVFLYGYTFFKLRFIWATLAGWTIVVAYEFAAISLTSTPVEILINNNFFFLAGNFIGMVAGYSIEFYSRRDFLQTRLLESEKKKVEEARKNLEKRVEERTHQLVEVNEELVDRVSEQKIAQEALTRKVNFEQLLTTLSTQFIHLRYNEIEKGMKSTVHTIGEFAQVDHSFLYLLNKKDITDQVNFRLFYKWNKDGNKKKDQLALLDMSWAILKLMSHESIILNHVNELPPEAQIDRNLIKSVGIKSLIVVPLLFKDELIGLIGLDSITKNITWSEENVSLLRIVGDMLVLAFERKNTEELLRQSEEQYHNLFEKSSDVVFISTPEGRFIDINPAGVKLFGFSSKKEILKINIAEDLYAEPDEREKFRTIIDREGYIKEFEVKLKTKEGNEIIAIETATVLRDDNGNVVAYQGIIRDITKKRKLENQVFQSQKMDSIGMLAGGIAHDFNNILTALRGYTDLALMKISREAPDENEIKGISRGIERAEDLTRQLLAFGRKQIIEPRVININQIILNLEKMLVRLIGEDINLKTILAEDVGQVKADPGQIEQILVNLIINARDAINQKDSHTTDKKITIETKQVYLDFGYVVNHPEVMVGDYLMIAVSDTGCGMNDDLIAKIYEPFYSTKAPGKGTGLGLSTVYGIVKQNQGNIYVYSEINKGSTFKIYWPMTEQELVSDFSEDWDEHLVEGVETILFVEDDDEVRTFMCQALESLKYKIIEASNGVEALEIVKQNNIKLDLLITDVIMPEMGGKELAEEIVKFVPGIKILFTSGYTDNHIVRSGRLDEGINFLLKPFSIKDISKKIRIILEN
jgi:PAS domain S-box-containing protein